MHKCYCFVLKLTIGSVDRSECIWCLSICTHYTVLQVVHTINYSKVSIISFRFSFFLSVIYSMFLTQNRIHRQFSTAEQTNRNVGSRAPIATKNALYIQFNVHHFNGLIWEFSALSKSHLNSFEISIARNWIFSFYIGFECWRRIHFSTEILFEHTKWKTGQVFECFFFLSSPQVIMPLFYACQMIIFTPKTSQEWIIINVGKYYKHCLCYILYVSNVKALSQCHWRVTHLLMEA